MRISYESCVSSTEVTPAKLSPPTKRKGSASSRMLKVSKQLKQADILSEVGNAASIQSASKRALQLFGKTSGVKRAAYSDSEDDDLDLYESRKKYKQASVESAESEDESSELRRARDEIYRLKKQLEEAGRRGRLHFKNVVKLQSYLNSPLLDMSAGSSV